MTVSSPILNLDTSVCTCRENYEQAGQWLNPIPFSRLPGETTYLVANLTNALSQSGIYSGDLIVVTATQPQAGDIVLGVAADEPGQLGGPILGRWGPYPKPSLGGRIQPLLNTPSIAKYEWLVLVSVIGVFYRSAGSSQYRSAADLRPHACPCCTCHSTGQNVHSQGLVLDLSTPSDISRLRMDRSLKSRAGRKPRFPSEGEFWAEAEPALAVLAVPLKGVFSIGRLARRMGVSRSMLSDYLRHRPDLRQKCEQFVNAAYRTKARALPPGLRAVK